MKLEASLSKSILKEYEKLGEIISRIPPSFKDKKKIESPTGLISVADLIAYNIGWGTLLISWYEAGIKNQMPQMPGDDFTTWDYNAIATHFYKKYHFDGNQKQFDAFNSVIARIIEIVEQEFKNKNLEKIGVWQWCTLKSGKQWPLSKWVTVNTVAPYKRAHALIRKYVQF